jgi:putative phage-type endonuclease
MERKGFIGGSDAPIILGLSPWKSPYQLWLEKIGQEEPEDISGLDHVHFGVVLEDVVAREWALRHNRKVRRMNNRAVHPKHDFILAQIDRRIVGGGILECKTTGAHNGDDWLSGPPAHYWVQVQHQMMTAEIDNAAIAVLIGGQRYADFEISADKKFQADLLDLELDFWDRVQRGVPPDPISTEEARRVWQKYTPLEVYASEEDIKNIKTLVEVRAKIEELEKQEESAKLALMSALKDIGDTLIVNNVPVVSWKSQQRTSVDLKALKERYPDIAKELTLTSESRVFRVLKGAEKI